MANEKVTGGSVIDAPAPPLPGASRQSARDVTADGAHGAGRRLQFALVLANEPASHDGAPLLCGIFPLEQQSHYQGLGRKLPFKTLRLWKHKYCYLCTPLVREGYGQQVIAAFFDWLDAGSHDCSLMEFRFIAGDGPFNSLLMDYFERHAKLHYITMYFLRAMFRPTIAA